jgi:nicotinamidase-related amidase
VTDGLEFDVSRAVLLPLDYTSTIVERYAFNGEAAVERASAVCAGARAAGVPVIHVAPGMYDPETQTTRHPGELHPSMRPTGDDTILYKRKIGAFSTTGLDVTLRLAGKDTLIIMGIATSGTVLSSTRWAFDLGYKIVVVTDACSDPEEEIHKILTEKDHDSSWVGLWRLATMTTSESLLAYLKA